MHEQHKRQLRGLMEDPRWGGFEAFIADFMRRHFVQGSIKRGDQFDTIWYAAEAEGGKRYLQLMIKEMEDAARSTGDESENVI